MAKKKREEFRDAIIEFKFRKKVMLREATAYSNGKVYERSENG